VGHAGALPLRAQLAAVLLVLICAWWQGLRAAFQVIVEGVSVTPAWSFASTCICYVTREAMEQLFQKVVLFSMLGGG
jgi:hypothetical protein